MNSASSFILTRLETLLSLDRKIPNRTEFLIKSVCDRLKTGIVFSEHLEITPNDSLAKYVIRKAIEVADSVISHPSLNDEEQMTNTPNKDLPFRMDELRLTLEDVIYAMEEVKQTDRHSLRSGGKEIVVGFDEETTILADRLSGGINKQLEMISIVGMPGLEMKS